MLIAMVTWMGFIVVFTGGVRGRSKVRHFGVGVSDFGKKSGPGTSVEVTEYGVITWIALQFAHLTVGIAHISENDGITRTNLLTGGLDRTICNLQIFDL